jgi:FkbM family methyltransferase
MRAVTTFARSLAERTLGVHISRTPPAPVTKHADQAIAQLRRWTPNDVVFDVGANDGRTVLRLQDLLARPRIFAFEPVASTYDTLVRRTSRFANVVPRHLALGAAPGRQTIYLNEIDAMNSFSANWTASHVGTETVEISTVDQVMEQERIPFLHFLKIDTEGYEREVLTGAERALRESRIAVIQVEVGVDQLGKDLWSLESARAFFAERGYYLYGIYNQCLTRVRAPEGWPPEALEGYRAEVLAYCDALFVKASL